MLVFPDSGDLSLRHRLKQTRGQSRGKQHRGLRTKALMQDLGTGLECPHRFFCKTEKTLWKFIFREKSMIAQWIRTSYPKVIRHDISFAPLPRTW